MTRLCQIHPLFPPSSTTRKIISTAFQRLTVFAYFILVFPCLPLVSSCGPTVQEVSGFALARDSVVRRRRGLSPPVLVRRLLPPPDKGGRGNEPSRFLDGWWAAVALRTFSSWLIPMLCFSSASAVACATDRSSFFLFFPPARPMLMGVTPFFQSFLSTFARQTPRLLREELLGMK